MQLHACSNYSGHLTCATSMYKAIIPGYCTVYRIAAGLISYIILYGRAS